MCGYLDDPRLFFCFVMVVHESLVCSEQFKLSSVLQKNPPCPAESSDLQHLLHIWNLRSTFSHWGQLRDSNTTIIKGSNIHWCSRRTHDALRSGGGGDFWTGWRCPNFSYFVEIFFLYIALRKQQKILACFPEDKLSAIYLDLQIQNVFTPPALNGSCFLLEDQWMFEPFLIVVFGSLNCPQSEKMVLKIIQSLLERVQICKRCWKTEESAGHGGFFWRTVLSLTVQNKQGTHEQPSQKKKKHTHIIKNQRFPNVWMGFF